MQLKNSMLLLTALAAGSTVARLHGHERRHHHNDKRAVGDIVVATIDGEKVSWKNEWSGVAATVAVEAEAAVTQIAVDAKPTQVSVTSSVVASVSAVPTAATSSSSSTGATASGSCSSWTQTLSSGDYSRAGFGKSTVSKRTTDAIYYTGNVGSPWGSNIIEVDASNACQYKHVVRIDGSETDDWTVVFWNKIGPTGGLNGWYGHSALTLTIKPGTSRYVAFDDDSQGGWGAAKGDKLPTDQYGGYSCTWGEFDFGNTSNDGWSGWDVSAIQAQNAGQEIQGMKICDHTGSGCSTITNSASSVINAYTAALAAADGIGGSVSAGPVRLQVNIDFS
ncbi:allergen Asp f 4 [Aspergillus sclerotioniger CBS 115572]|uniref:Allergen Asp f 4 n=1 Tax=Aspergillus sclerotioniger CBS 115572 TaxID=1450535 RepID=A0A317VZ17_9EURO|nr:allergen Asp f 4 [Aspergillus sclerotioniger CBS 115572]PWY78571.1 allergen Asp f 4 [Aspergillus sclerotioniger CBS 115572]